MIHSIVILPLLGFLIACTLSFFKRSASIDRLAEVITCTFIVLAAFFSFYIFIANIGSPSVVSLKLFTWIESGSFSADWSIYLDSVTSVMLVVITSVSALVHVYSIGYMSHDDSKPRFMGYLSLFTFAMIMLVTADNFLQLFFGWEGVGLASYLLIGFWYKKPTANAAAIKAFIVNRVGDFGLALGIFTIFIVFGSIEYENVFNSAAKFSDTQFAFIGYEIHALTLICIFLFIGAMGKSAQLFLHTWLPDAHVEAPTAGSVILAGVLLKMAGYGFIRFSLGIFPIASSYFAPFIFTLSIIAIIYASLVALVQTDMKKLIAYSSVAHMGFVTLGIFTFTLQGIEGAIIQMLSHGIISAALFLCVGVVYDRIHTREIDRYGGLVNRMPIYAFAFMIFIMGSIGLPGTSGFVGEFLVLLSIFSVNTYFAVFATSGVVLAAAYSLWLYRKVIFGSLIKDDLQDILDLSYREIIILFPLAFLTIFFGFYPQPLIDIIEPSTIQLITNIANDVAIAEPASYEPVIKMESEY